MRDALTNGHEAAFARPYAPNGSNQDGLTKREWLTGMALAAAFDPREGIMSPGLIADRAVRIADAVLERLAR